MKKIFLNDGFDDFVQVRQRYGKLRHTRRCDCHHCYTVEQRRLSDAFRYGQDDGYATLRQNKDYFLY